VEKWFLKEWVLPPEISAAGIQRLWRGTNTNDLTLNSGALIDDEGRLAGLLLNGPAGLALGADDLSHSMQRLANGKRETDPLRDFGVSLYYKLQNDEAEGRQFIAEVTSVVEGSPAAQSGVRAQDEIIGINGSTLDWNKSIVNLLNEQPVRELSVRRGIREELLVITVSSDQQ
jgi:S1-C subfamily serine protease